MSSGQDYNWEMTGPPSESSWATDPQAAQSWNDYVQSGGGGWQAQEIAPPTYEQQVQNAQSWGVPQDQIASIVGTPESVAANNAAAAGNINSLYGFTPSWAGDYGYTAPPPTWLNPADYVANNFAAPYTQQQISAPVDPSWIRKMEGQTYASVKGPSDLSGGEYLVDPTTGKFALDKNGNPIGVTYPKSHGFDDWVTTPLGSLALTFGVPLLAAGATYALPYLAGEAALGTGAATGATGAATTAAPAVATTAAPAVATQATGLGGATLNSILAGAGKGALTGAAMGGISSGLQGGNILQGTLRGGITGAVGGGLGGGLTSAFPTWSPYAVNALSGAGAGATGSALTGGNIGQGALYGAGSGVLNTALRGSDFARSLPEWARSPVVQNAITGAAISKAMGGDYMRGAASGALGGYLSSGINNAYNEAFGSPRTINVTANQPIDPRYSEGSGYAGDGSYTQPTLPSGTSPYIKTGFEEPLPSELGAFGGAAKSYVPGDVIESKTNPGNSLQINSDGSLTARTPMGETVIPESYANKALEYVLTQNAKHDAYWKDYVPGQDYAGPKQEGMMNIPSTYEGYRTQDMLQYPDFKGAGTYEQLMDVRDTRPTKEIDGIEYETGGFYDTKVWDPETNSYRPIQAPEGAGGLSTAPYNQPGLEPTGSTTATAEIGKVDNKPVQPPNPDAPVLENPTRQALLDDAQDGQLPTKEKVDAALAAGKISKEEADTYKEVIKEVEDATGGTGTKGTGPGAGLAGTGPGRGTEEGPAGALGIEGLIGDMATMASFNSEEPGPGEGGTGEDMGGGAGGGGGGAGGGGGSGSGTGSGKGTGGGRIGGGALPYKYPTMYGGQGVAPTNPGLTNLTPGLTKANLNYLLAGLGGGLPTINPTHEEAPVMHAATGGLATNTQPGTAESLTPGVTPRNVEYELTGLSPLGKAKGGSASTADLFDDNGAYNYANISDSKLSPSITKHNVGYTLTGMPTFNKAEGGLVHNPQFYSEGGASIENRYVQGQGDGTSDSIPAMLSNGEFVIPADVVSGLGNGSNDSGAKILDEFLRVIREHKQKHDAKSLPPKSKSPKAYLTDAKRKVKK